MNKERRRQAHDLLIASLEAEALLIAECNKAKIKSHGFWTDYRMDAAIELSAMNSKVDKAKRSDGFVAVDLPWETLYSIYISQNIDEDEGRDGAK